MDAMNGVQASSTPVQISKHDPMPTSLPLACPPPQILWQLGNLQAHISPQLVFPHRLPHEEITTASLDAAGVILQPAIMSNDSNANSSTPPALSPYGWAGTKLSRMHLDGNRTIGVQIDVKVRMINPNP